MSVTLPTWVARIGLSLVVASLCFGAGTARADRWADDLSVEETWVSTRAEAVLRAEPAPLAERLAVVRPGTALRVLETGANWTQVFDPRTDTTAYVRADLLAPRETPPGYLHMEPLPLDLELNTLAIATTEVPLYTFPTRDELAQATILKPSRRESIVGVVHDGEGEPWYQLADGYYLPSDGLFLSNAPREFEGRWLDVSLGGGARVVAYDGGEVVRSFGAIKGTAKFPTPLGVWSIVRRVYNETMDSATIGIPRDAPGGYFLKNVLYTQYFRETGESLHYNWWSSAWGSAGSHGCLGLSMADSRWLWEWADVGTPVVIHS